MTTDELINKVKNTELLIQSLLNVFNKETGFIITNVDVTIIDTPSKLGTEKIPCTVSIIFSH